MNINRCLKWAAIVALLMSPVFVAARLTGTNPSAADAHCVGASGAETCTDASGNHLPTTDDDATSGTSSLRWSAVHAMDVTVGDDVTVADDLTVTDDAAVNGDTTLGNAAADNVTINASSVTTGASVRVSSPSASVPAITSAPSATANLVGINNGSPAETLDVGGNITFSGTIAGTTTGAIGVFVEAAGNQACNTTCTKGCIAGQDAGTSNIFVECTDATADVCLCLGNN